MVKALETQGYPCGNCVRIHRELTDAAVCCASDRHRLIGCWRCYECGALYSFRCQAEDCCTSKKLEKENSGE